jgi:septum formation protein
MREGVMIILASKSPRRETLLRQLFEEFIVIDSNIIENVTHGEPPRALVTRLAREKALSAVSIAGHPHCLVLGADTAVVLDDHILGKPSTPEEAGRMLAMLLGREHLVITGYCVLKQPGAESVCGAVETRVKMRAATQEEIDRYVATGEPLDKAGGYAIQGLGAVFVESVQGSFSNVVGLPLEEVARAFLQLDPSLLERGIMRKDAPWAR